MTPVNINIRNDMRKGFDFEWPVDEAGYDWVQRPGTVLTQSLAGWRLQPRGGALRRYRPLEHPELARRFVREAVGREGARTFAERWGLLDERWGGRFTSIEERRRKLDALFQMLDFSKSPVDAEASATYFNHHIQVPLYLRFDTVASPPRLCFAPASLYDALLIQVANEIAGLRRVAAAACMECSRPIPVFAGQRTRGRKFCSDRCRVAWHRHHPQGD